MTTPVQSEPETTPTPMLGARRSAAIADAQAKAALYTRVSRTAATERDPRVATGAAWISDVLAVRALVWERAPGDDEEAGRRLSAVATAVGAAVGAATDTASAVPARDAREVVVTARRRLLGVFDGPAAALVAERLGELEYLAELPAVAGRVLPESPESLRWRSQNATAEVLVSDLRRAAADCRVIADALLAAAYRRDAAGQACLADLFEIEAYLVEASLAAGDTDLLLADVRRAAVVLLLSEAADRPVDVAAARAGVWAVVRAALPPTEVERLAPRLGRSGPVVPE
ncbi:MAG TPA: hypothetical protein VNC22_10495 [Sporichthya sp.]|nr:hypothetical protein [Sporichthya sp.]